MQLDKVTSIRTRLEHDEQQVTCSRRTYHLVEKDYPLSDGIFQLSNVHFFVFQSVLLNCLTSEFVIIENPLSEGEEVVGVNLLNSHFFILGPITWCQFDMRGNLENK
jgi:hypothetical protein